MKKSRLPGAACACPVSFTSLIADAALISRLDGMVSPGVFCDSVLRHLNLSI